MQCRLRRYHFQLLKYASETTFMEPIIHSKRRQEQCNHFRNVCVSDRVHGINLRCYILLFSCRFRYLSLFRFLSGSLFVSFVFCDKFYLLNNIFFKWQCKRVEDEEEEKTMRNFGQHTIVYVDDDILFNFYMDSI